MALPKKSLTKYDVKCAMISQNHSYHRLTAIYSTKWLANYHNGSKMELWKVTINHPPIYNPYSKFHGPNMGPTWVLSAPDWPHVGPMNLAVREGINVIVWKFQLEACLKDKAHGFVVFCLILVISSAPGDPCNLFTHIL